MCAKKCAGRPSNRDVILDAAEQLVASEGAARLTFDALGQATGISKGGLLYHFASKDKLLEAMLERMVARNTITLLCGARRGCFRGVAWVAAESSAGACGVRAGRAVDTGCSR